jgi:hypothetical protein
MVFELWRDRLPWIIEHDGEYFQKWQIYKSAISWTSQNRRTFSLIFGCPVFPNQKSFHFQSNVRKAHELVFDLEFHRQRNRKSLEPTDTMWRFMQRDMPDNCVNTKVHMDINGYTWISIYIQRTWSV